MVPCECLGIMYRDPFLKLCLKLTVAPYRPEVNAASLTFFLVMPVQRIARYPLLLQTIQKHTDPMHPAYPALEQAFHVAVEMNCNINEYKRFREVGEGVAVHGDVCRHHAWLTP